MRRPLALAVAAATSAYAAAPTRCDLVSQASASKCLDLALLDGSTLRVPSNTTRIPSTALNLCGIPGSTPPPTDIVYIVDQSTSMRPNLILPGAEDTSGWYGCNPTVRTLPGTIDFHGSTVSVAAAGTTAATLAANCSVAGDPYSVRASTIQQAVRSQAAMEPNSSAAVVQFNGSILPTPTPMTSLATPAGVKLLVDGLNIDYQNGTNYEAPMTWARILLNGGTSSLDSAIPASPSPAKAIILLSDGRPMTGVWANALKAVTTVSNVPGNPGTWTTGSPSIPPVYGIYMGIDAIAGNELQTISTQTNGAFYQIPPYMPDSLAMVIKKILGTLIKPAIPETFTLTNLTNGQTGRAAASVADGNSFKMLMDSLVSLVPGTNNLSLSLKEGAKTISAKWTIVVSDDPVAGPASPLDSLLTRRCAPPTSLSLKPDRSGHPYAVDSLDQGVLITLQTIPDAYAALPISLRTLVSSDRENSLLPVPAGTPQESAGIFSGSIAWQPLSQTGSGPLDLVVRSGQGWDTLIGYFQMPRDLRDTASAMLALRRRVPPALAMTPAVDGPSGRIVVTVVDSNVYSASVTVRIKHRQGDSIDLVLPLLAPHLYRLEFGFEPGTAVPGNTVLETGPLASGTDTISGSYQNLSAASLVKTAIARLRFLDEFGLVHDTLSFDLLPAATRQVTVQLWLGNSPCLSCTGTIGVASSAPGVQILSKTGIAISAAPLFAGQATVSVKGLAPTPNASIVFVDDSFSVAVAAQPIRVLPIAPDSVVYEDLDGDGALDRATLHRKLPWNASNDLLLPWPDSSRYLPWREANRTLSADTLVEVLDFAPQMSNSTGARTALVAMWRHDTNWPWQPVKVVERIAPVPMRAVLTRGRLVDTLRIPPSEPLWPALSPLTNLVKNETSISGRNLSPTRAYLDASTGALILLIPADSTGAMVRPGDSVRFLSAVKDGLGNAPGTFAKSVVVEGSDPAPDDAVILDTDADGRADRVVVRLRAPLSVTDLVGFSWPDSTGVLQTRTLAPQAAISDSGDMRLTFDVDPFEFASTACPDVGCQDLGFLSTARFGSPTRTGFAIRDGLDPIPTLARYRFSSSGRIPDTLLVSFSEKVKTTGNGSWVSTGHPEIDSFGTSLSPLSKSLAPAGRAASFLVDTSNRLRTGDQLRITAAPGGAISDTAGNAPDKFAYWTPIVWNQPPPLFSVDLPHPVVTAPFGSAPSNEPPMTLLVHPGPTSTEWVSHGVATPEGLDQRFGGVVAHLNRIPQELGVYIYDNLGVLVVKRELTELESWVKAGIIVQNQRGEYDIWLAWNGKDEHGRDVLSGVYTMRVYGWLKEDNHYMVLNLLRNIGFRRGQER
jgi:hypothetical protein